ncbi:MAG: hypothetical protein IID32_12500, partial [Planctomycetes bacterium]|nr:hypothetical protein [Planctomycetota bacterium]
MATGSSTVTRGRFTSVQVNVDAFGSNIPGDAANEPSIAVDPTNPDHIVIVWRQFDTITSSFRQAGHAYSHDAGVTWTFPGVLTPGVFRSDPVLDVDAEGTFYYYTLKQNFTSDLFKSSDGGVTWSDPIPAPGGDKAWFVIDRTGGMGNGHLYHAASQTRVSRSTDGGLTFQSNFDAPVDLARVGTLAVSGNGSLFAVNGGFITMQGGSIHAAVGSVIDAGGAVNGGTVAIIGQDPNGVVNLNGTVNASGGTGNGGLITVTGAGDVNVGRDAVMNADGADGGLVSIDSEGTTTQAGTVTALGTVGKGGTANVTGQSVIVVVQATMDVSGLTGGGQINIGGGFQGNDKNLRNSESTIVGGLATLKADAINTGDAGNVVVWSSGDTIFGGEIYARALGKVGRGGLIEVSGKKKLSFRGEVNASAVSGQSGTVLFDPGTVTVGGVLSTIPIASLNTILQTNNTSVIIATSGVGSDIIFESMGPTYGSTTERRAANFRDVSVQWNTDASLGIFAGGDVRFNNAVRTAGAGSINVIAGWTGTEADPILGAPGPFPQFGGGPEAVWDFYVAAGQFGGGPGGAASGNIYINDPGNNRFVEVGSRYGETNLAANNVFLFGAGTRDWRHGMVGFRDTGVVFNQDTNFSNGYANLRLMGNGAVGARTTSYIPTAI